MSSVSRTRSLPCQDRSRRSRAHREDRISWRWDLQEKQISQLHRQLRRLRRPHQRPHRRQLHRQQLRPPPPPCWGGHRRLSSRRLPSSRPGTSGHPSPISPRPRQPARSARQRLRLRRLRAHHRHLRCHRAQREGRRSERCRNPASPARRSSSTTLLESLGSRTPRLRRRPVWTAGMGRSHWDRRWWQRAQRAKSRREAAAAPMSQRPSRTRWRTCLRST